VTGKTAWWPDEAARTHHVQTSRATSGFILPHGILTAINHPAQFHGLRTCGGKGPNCHRADCQALFATAKPIIKDEASKAGRGNANAEPVHVIAALRIGRIITDLLISCMCSYSSIRRNNPGANMRDRLEQIDDYFFMVGLVAMTFISVLFAYEFV
jgi:hypothetical protein